ncbi:hypothetical protein [Roseicella aquatilis]|uniref:Lipoprotein n=1 Tax=Roseicella aquatilis TaxID=2527868 RepID=A0A4R4DNF5_9PROT|nr:hypothetical protein [Roseicella aquatilis]TCZ63175.1 hypothetical protein EXY23_10070 [Roseicella aquatilis]
MNIRLLSLGLLAGLGLAACADVKTQSGPPVAGTSTGTGVAPLQQSTGAIGGANSPNASAGQATITGTRSTGDGTKPSVDYTGTAAGQGVGSPTPVQPTPRSRANKGS